MVQARTQVEVLQGAEAIRSGHGLGLSREYSVVLLKFSIHTISSFTLLVGTSSKAKYTKQTYDSKYAGTKPILVLCTDDGLMPMANDKVFITANQSTEMFVPMLHFRDAQKSVEAKLRKCSQNYNPEYDTSD